MGSGELPSRHRPLRRPRDARSPGGLPDAGVYVGGEEIRGYMRQFLLDWVEAANRGEEIVEAGARGSGSGPGGHALLPGVDRRGHSVITIESIKERDEALKFWAARPGLVRPRYGLDAARSCSTIDGANDRGFGGVQDAPGELGQKGRGELRATRHARAARLHRPQAPLEYPGAGGCTSPALRGRGLRPVLPRTPRQHLRRLVAFVLGQGPWRNTNPRRTIIPPKAGSMSLTDHNSNTGTAAAASAAAPRTAHKAAATVGSCAVRNNRL